MSRVSGRVLLEDPERGIEIDLSAPQIQLVRKGFLSIQVNQQLVRLAIGHSNRIQELRRGDFFHRTSCIMGPSPLRVYLHGPTKVLTSTRCLKYSVAEIVSGTTASTRSLQRFGSIVPLRRPIPHTTLLRSPTRQSYEEGCRLCLRP